MNFLNPFFLLGLLSVAVPVMIHLINLRKPQKIPFSTLAFFEELKKSTIRRIRIKRILLLALRVLAVLLLAFALARPYLPSGLGGDQTREQSGATILMIDNSPSMGRIGAQGPLIDQAKTVADQVIATASDNERFVVATTNGDQAGMVLVGAGRAQELVRQVSVNNSGNFMADKAAFIANQLRQMPVQQGMIYLITDGQASQLKVLENLSTKPFEELDKPVGIQPVFLGDPSQPNLAVSDLSLQSRMVGKGSPITLNITVKNFGTAAAANQFVSVELDERMIGQYEVNLDPGETRELLFEFIPERVGDLTGEVLLEGDEITFDNRRYFVVSIPRTRRVLLVNDERQRESEFASYLSPALEAARQSNTQLSFSEVTPPEVDQSNWLQNDVIVLDGLKQIPEYWFKDLQRFVQEGHGVLFLPSEQGVIANYNRYLELFNAGEITGIRGEYGNFNTVTRMSELREGHPILEGLFDKEDEEEIRVDLPRLYYYYRYRPGSNAGSYSILTTEIGDRLLVEQRFGEGRLLVSTLGADPGWSNFPVNPLFAPLMYRTVLYASASGEGGLNEAILGRTFEWQSPFSSQDIRLSLNGEQYRPEVQGVPDGVLISYEAREWNPGLLEVSAGSQTRYVAINQHIMESDFATLSNQQWEQMLGSELAANDPIALSDISERTLNEELSTASIGKEIWHWFVWIALLLLITETLLSRAYKAETIS